MERARIDSTAISHVVVCGCGFRVVCMSSAAARDARDRHDLVAHPEHYRQALSAISKRSARSR